MPGTTSVWRHRGFRRLYAGSTISSFGSEISELAVPLLAIGVLHATSAEVGLLRAVQFAPFLLLTLHAGILVDRVRRRPLMITADFGRFVAIGAIPLLIWLGAEHIWPMLILVFIAGTLTVVHQIADTAYLPSLLDRDSLMSANSKIGAAQSAAQLGGQGIGGLLVSWLTAPFAVLVDAFSYLISGLLVAGIPHREEPPEVPADRRLGPEIREGLAFVLRSRIMRALVGEAATFNFAHEIFLVGFFVWTARDLDLSAFVIGILLSLGAVGAFVGASFGERLSLRYGFGRTMLATIIVGNAVALVVIFARGGGAGTIALLATAFLVQGFGTALANVHNVTLRQTAVPTRLQGRVNASYRLISWGVIPLGAGLGGVLAGTYGNRTGMIIGAVGLALSALWIVFSPIPRMSTAPQQEDLQEPAVPR
ncbi:MFS transporter [Paractinoplanes ferrugineus]|uniref:MFS transporter n=1 Tax=Paractinoplanes ferrugineus TaxID=113564 RepID=A0A919J3M7_9ACTN|nr:MFS transporter [Actinoplanes ferrugineus]GIE13340.1 MFS transporter [Actinoplanes ferrugineus]